MFGEKLRLALKKCGYTQEEFAEKLNTSRTLVNQWVNGKTPSTNSLKKISKVLNIPINNFFEEDSLKNNASNEKYSDKNVDLIMKLVDEKMKNFSLELSFMKKEIEFLKNENKLLKKEMNLSKKK